MPAKSEKDKQKELQEKHQAILSALLKDDDNKYCADCDAKGPRWASWNLGVFLCIRCAGIHRNMGVHISRVKSVNLDSWTPEQIAMVQSMGNSKGRAVYEANIPDNYRRPQSESLLESFIRAKYEHKKYIAHEWVPTQPKVQPIVDEKKEKKRAKPKSSVEIPPVIARSEKPSEPIVAVPRISKINEVHQKEQERIEAAKHDLLGLDDPPAEPSNVVSLAKKSDEDDLFGDFLGSSALPAPTVQPTGGEGETSLLGETKTKCSKESILALYGNSSTTQQPNPQTSMYGVPGGMYMAAPPQGMMANGMTGMMPQNHMTHMMQGQQMMGNGAMMGTMPSHVPGHATMQNRMMPGQVYAYPAMPQQMSQMQNQFINLSMAATPSPMYNASMWSSTPQTASHGQTLSTNLWQ